MNSLLSDAAAGGLAAASVLLVIAGATKTRDFRGFGSQIAAYAILPRVASRIAGYILPVGEIGVGVLAIVSPRAGGAAVAVLFAAFAVAIGVNLIRGRTELVCGCFGPRGRHRITRWQVAGDAALATIAVVASVTNAHVTLPAAVLGITVLVIVVLLAAVGQALSPWPLNPVKED